MYDLSFLALWNLRQKANDWDQLEGTDRWMQYH